jgi:PPOX class probable F420-dependent enzyme
MDDADLRRRVAAARVARLATVEPDGRAHLVPICFALDDATLYSAVDGKSKRSRDLRRLRNVRERPVATVLVDHYEEDWERLWWVRIRGPARVVEAGGREEVRAIALLVEKYRQYRVMRPTGPVLALTLAECRGWEASPATAP